MTTYITTRSVKAFRRRDGGIITTLDMGTFLEGYFEDDIFVANKVNGEPKSSWFILDGAAVVVYEPPAPEPDPVPEPISKVTSMDFAFHYDTDGVLTSITVTEVDEDGVALTREFIPNVA